MDDSDIEALQSVDGVDEAVGMYGCYVFFPCDGEIFQARALELTESMDRPFQVEGRLPATEYEVALDADFAKNHGIHIGDTLNFRHDEGSSTRQSVRVLQFDPDTDDLQAIFTPDDEPMDYLKHDSCTITALVRSPEYLAQNTANYGIDPVNRMSISCFLYFSQSAFDKTAFGGYPYAGIRSSQLHKFPTVSKDYSEKAEAIIDNIREYTDRMTDKKGSDIDNVRVALGKTPLADTANAILSELPDVSCTFLTRKQNVGFTYCERLFHILKNVRYLLAGLFLVVAMLVCYSSVFRMVFEQSNLIGISKSFGFTDLNVICRYLIYTMSILIPGSLLGAGIGYFVVEKMLMIAAKKNLKCMMSLLFSPWEPIGALVGEGAVLLLITILACYRICRINGYQLLNKDVTKRNVT